MVAGSLMVIEKILNINFEIDYPGSWDQLRVLVFRKK